MRIAELTKQMDATVEILRSVHEADKAELLMDTIHSLIVKLEQRDRQITELRTECWQLSQKLTQIGSVLDGRRSI